MTNDGSNLGVSAERALKTILGGEPEPEGEELATREQVRARLAAAPRLQDIHVRIEARQGVKVEVLYWQGMELNLGYGEAADVAARAILDFIETYPEYEDAPGENQYAEDCWEGFDGSAEKMPKPIRLGLYDLMKAAGHDLGKLDLTGFMWGFAYNTARWLRYEQGEGNPAIIEM